MTDQSSSRNVWIGLNVSRCVFKYFWQPRLLSAARTWPPAGCTEKTKSRKKQVAKQRGCSWSSSGSLTASHKALSRPRQAKGPPAPPRDFTGVVSNTIKWRKEVSVSVRRLFAVRDQFYLRGHAGNVFHVGVGADERRPHHSFPLQEPDWLHRGLHAWRKLKVWSLGQFLFCFLNNFDIHLYVIMYITP